MKKPRVTVVSFIGRPFAGKDFQANRLKEIYPQISVISTGEKLRDELFIRQKFTPEEADYIKQTMNAGTGVKNEIVERIMHEAILDEATKGYKMIILAGYPRTVEQFTALNNFHENETRNGKFKIKEVYINFQITEEKANQRREERLLTERRDDDRDLGTVARRHKTFETFVPPMNEEISRRNHFWRRTFFSINADTSRESVTKTLERILRHNLPRRRGIEGNISKKEVI